MARTAAANAPGRSAPYTSTRRVSANPGWYASFGHLASSDDEDEDTLPGRSAGSSTRGAASRTAALDAADEDDDEFTEDEAEEDEQGGPADAASPKRKKRDSSAARKKPVPSASKRGKKQKQTSSNPDRDFVKYFVKYAPRLPSRGPRCASTAATRGGAERGRADAAFASPLPQARARC